MIPKTIHYVWLSGEELPELNRKCIESWQTALKDYEIRKWTLDDFDLSRMPYVREAVKERKWAFATDCLRAEILFSAGGIYLDSDVYVYENFDSLLNERFFSCIEFHHDSVASVIQTACMGAEAGHPFIKACTDYYRERSFVNDDGSLDDDKLAPDVYAEIAETFGFDINSREEQFLNYGMHIYTESLVAGTPWEINPLSLAVHMCAGSWRDGEQNELSLINALKLYMI